MGPASSATGHDDPESRYIVISGDSHVGPSLDLDLREYCPQKYLEEFNEFCRYSKLSNELEKRFTAFATPSAAEAYIRSSTCPGLRDPGAFLEDMDRDGVAASVIFAGGGNNEPIPWIGGGIMQGESDNYPDELARIGARIWNEWLVDFTGTDPDRLLGVAQIPMGNLNDTITEVHWAAEHGLRAINFPAPRANLVPYNNLFYEPFWSVIEDTGLPLLTHGGSGDPTNAPEGSPGYFSIVSSELMWLSRRALPQLLFGGVFQRHKNLRLVFTEQRADWVGSTLRDLDSIYFDPNRDDPNRPPRSPSDYWKTNCFVTGSFMAPHEAALHREVGPHNLLWASDYPHPEGTWPRTRIAMRNTFCQLPSEEVRPIIGENAIPVFNLDLSVMRGLADRIGPSPSDLSRPLALDEFPEHRGLSFREYGAFA